MTPANRVVTAACKTKSGLIVVGVRHCDGIMRAQVEASGEKDPLMDQGFIDNRGNYLDRKEALILATEAGQIGSGSSGKKTGSKHELYSEDIH